MSDTEARASDDATPADPSTAKHKAPADPASDAVPVPPPAGPDTGTDTDSETEDEGEPPAEPSWWHRSHPTFAGLMGFFTGVAYVIIVPGIYATLLGALLPEKAAQRLFPLIAVALVVPIGMLVARKTRRFAEFMLLGVVSTALVIALTATLVIWVMVKTGG